MQKPQKTLSVAWDEYVSAIAETRVGRSVNSGIGWMLEPHALNRTVLISLTLIVYAYIGASVVMTVAQITH